MDLLETKNEFDVVGDWGLVMECGSLVQTSRLDRQAYSNVKKRRRAAQAQLPSEPPGNITARFCPFDASDARRSYADSTAALGFEVWMSRYHPSCGSSGETDGHQGEKALHLPSR